MDNSKQRCIIETGKLIQKECINAMCVSSIYIVMAVFLQLWDLILYTCVTRIHFLQGRQDNASRFSPRVNKYS